MATRRQRVKSIYFPKHPEGKTGVVAVSFREDDPDQMELFQKVEKLGSTELRRELGLEDWDELQNAKKDAKTSVFLRGRLAERLRASTPDKELSQSGRAIRSAPPGTEDSLERANEYMTWVEDHRRKKNQTGPVRLIDPFAGTGNFLVAAAARGWESWYCENDPVARRHLELKLAILSRAPEARKMLGREIEALSGQLEDVFDEVAERGGEAMLDATREPIAAAYEALVESRARGGNLLDDDTRDRAIVARKVADALLSENSLLGGCFEVAAAWAAASCARSFGRQSESDSESSRRRRSPIEFDVYVRRSLSDFVSLCSSREVLSARPTFLCDDARDLGRFDNLGLNAIVTTLPPFEAVNQTQPSQRIQAWMLRQPDPASSGPKTDVIVRDTLATVRQSRGREKDGGFRDSRDLSPGEVSAFLFEGKVPGESYFFRQLDEALGSEFREMARRIREAKRDQRSFATLQRAGLMAVRYFCMLAQVLRALLNVRDTTGRGGVAIIEVASTSAANMHVNTPDLVARYLKSVQALEIRRVEIERRRTKGGETVREVLVFGFPEGERLGPS